MSVKEYPSEIRASDVTNPCPDDDSYRAAKEMAENGSLGEIHAVQTTCMDQQDPTGEHFPE